MRVTLNQSNHTYTDNKGQLYKAVSSVIAQYKQPFNAHAKQPNGKTLIQNYAEKHGESEQYWLDKWDEKRDYACVKGTAFHNLKELYVNGQSIHKSMPVRNYNLQWQLPEREGMFHLLEPGVYTEMALWNYLHRVAGTPDLTTIFPSGEFDIDDYKTNGKFETESFRGRTMKWPFHQLPDCHIGHYTVQLSIYAWLLEQFGLKARSLKLHHYDIPEKDVERILQEGILPDIEPTIHEVPYLHKEIDTIMKSRLVELKAQRRR